MKDFLTSKRLKIFSLSIKAFLINLAKSSNSFIFKNLPTSTDFPREIILKYCFFYLNIFLSLSHVGSITF